MAAENDNLYVSATRSLESAMSRMMLDPDFADLIVTCGNKEWKLHTALLAARSPFFKVAISTNMKEKLAMKIDIMEMDPEAMEQVVFFMYGMPVEKGPIRDLFEAAERFQMKDLMDDVSKFAVKEMSVDTVVEIGHLAELYSVESLIEECAHFMVMEDIEVAEDTPPKLITKVVKILKDDLQDASDEADVTERELVDVKSQLEAANIDLWMTNSELDKIKKDFEATQNAMKNLKEEKINTQKEDAETIKNQKSEILQLKQRLKMAAQHYRMLEQQVKAGEEYKSLYLTCKEDVAKLEEKLQKFCAKE